MFVALVRGLQELYTLWACPYVRAMARVNVTHPMKVRLTKLPKNTLPHCPNSELYRSLRFYKMRRWHVGLFARLVLLLCMVQSK